MALLLIGRQNMRLIRGIHPRITMLLRGRLMIRLLSMEPLIIIGIHLILNIYRSWTQSRMSLLFFTHLLEESPYTHPTPMGLSTVASEIPRSLIMHQGKSNPPSTDTIGSSLTEQIWCLSWCYPVVNPMTTNIYLNFSSHLTLGCTRTWVHLY